MNNKNILTKFSLFNLFNYRIGRVCLILYKLRIIIKFLFYFLNLDVEGKFISYFY